MKLFGITGRARSGKDTLVNTLLSAGYDVGRVAFADALKEEVCAATGVSLLALEQHKELYRPLLQWWGTEFRRGQDQDYWIKRVAARLPWSTDDVVFVTDVRFENEADFIRRMGGTIIRVVRVDGATTAHAGHVTEFGSDRIAEHVRLENPDFEVFHRRVLDWWTQTNFLIA